MPSTLWGYLDPAEHAHMLLDVHRVGPYARAIAATVQPGDVVLDVGTGSGVLALLAARAGARKVYAIDRTGVVALARRHVADNGLDGVVEVIRADLTAIDALPEPPRVVVGEILGHFAPAEGVHRAYASAARLVRPDAVWIPSRYRLVFGAVRARGLREDVARLEDLEGLRMTTLVEHLVHRPAFVRVDPAELLGPEVEGAWLSTTAPPPRDLTARVTVTEAGEVAAITTGFTAELAPGIELRTAIAAPRTCWHQTWFPVWPPLPVSAGDVLEIEIVPRIATTLASWAWTVRRGADQRSGDAFDSFFGEDRRDVLDILRSRPERLRTLPVPPALRAFVAACGGEAADAIDLDDLVRRVRAAMPTRYPNDEEARQELLDLFTAAERLG